MVSEVALAVDHQQKVVQKIQKEAEESNRQSFVIVGDGGMSLMYIKAPDTSFRWVDHVMQEVVHRHAGKLPKLCYMDCNCCNGTLGGCMEKNMFWYVMLKCLNAMLAS